MASSTQNPKANPAELADSFCREAAFLENTKKYRKAFLLWLKAAELGDIGAQVNLGNYYAAGRGTAKNLSEAERWYKKAYKAGHSAGANNLACDKRDAGNYRSAVHWFNKAIALDDGDSAVELAKMHIKRKRQRPAIAVLQKALLMDRASICEGSREEAELLLKKLKS